MALEGKSVNGFTIELNQNLEYVTQLFNAKFEIERLGTPKVMHGKFKSYFQIKALKITTSFLDFYYHLEEIKLN